MRLAFPRWLKDKYWQHTCKGDVFHSPNFFLPPYADNGVVTIHDLSVFKFPETHPIERIKAYEKSFDQSLRRAAQLITGSETTRLEIISYLNWPADRITAIHHGVSSLFVPSTLEKCGPILSPYGLRFGAYSLCVSTIEPRKSIDSLLKAYGRLPQAILSAFPLVLVGGKGWRSEHLHALINAAQHEGWLHYLEFVDETDLPAIYAGAHLFIYPSIYEGFGLPVAEAMASGVPVITSGRSALPEIAAGAARLIDPEDTDAFFAAIEESIVDKDWRQQAIKNGLVVAKKYDWDRCTKQTLNVYMKCVDRQ
jgi:alpha-1,3-rhamnosyl/mannosyltransferase